MNLHIRMSTINCFIIASAATVCSCAALAMTCPTNFSIIHAGDSMDSVIAACGKPDSQKETDKPNDNVPQEWSYFIPQSVATFNPGQTMSGTLKATVSFDASGKVINITVNGIGVGASTICGEPIQLGSTRDDIKAACGDPAINNKQQPPAGQETIKTVEFDYNTNPPQQLIFVNGKLQEQ